MRPIKDAPILKDEMERDFPDVAYHGGIYEDEDEMDYVDFAPKGVRLG